MFVAQGRHISYTGTTGSEPGDYDDHLHFQENTSTTSVISQDFTMAGVSNFAHTLVHDDWADSDNLAPGYTTPPIDWDEDLHDKYEDAGGWDPVGSTSSIPAWSPGRYTGGPCGTGGTPGWYECTSNSRSGIIQTFKGAGSGEGEHAIFMGDGESAAFMSRGPLGGFTDIWSNGEDGLHHLGYPTGDSFPIGGGEHRMNHQDGYWVYDANAGETRFYTYDSLGNPILLHTSNYWD